MTQHKAGSTRKRRRKAVPVLGAAGLSLTLASAASAAIDRPAVARLELLARPPGSTADEVHTVGNADDPLVFLPQTELELRLSASEPLSVAQVVAKDEGPKDLDRVGPTDFRLRWTMRDSQTLELRLVDRH